MRSDRLDVFRLSRRPRLDPTAGVLDVYFIVDLAG